MRAIECNTRVLVLTGYTDCQMQYPGFEATVIAYDGVRYRVRDQQGQELDCLANELTPLAESAKH